MEFNVDLNADITMKTFEEFSYKQIYKQLLAENSLSYVMMVVFSVFIAVITLLFSYLYKT